MKDEIGFFVSVLLGVSIITGFVFGFLKLAGHLFDVDTGPSFSKLEIESIKICKDRGGIPVLEDHGTTYKTCTFKEIK